MLDGVGQDHFFVDLLFPNPANFSHKFHLVQILWWIASKYFWKAKIPLANL
jgi:hypothetical protein